MIREIIINGLRTLNNSYLGVPCLFFLFEESNKRTGFRMLHMQGITSKNHESNIYLYELCKLVELYIHNGKKLEVQNVMSTEVITVGSQFDCIIQQKKKHNKNDTTKRKKIMTRKRES